MGPEYLGMPSTAKKSQSYGHFPYLPYGFIKSQDILLKSPNHEYRRGKMWLDVAAKYLIVWVVGNSLHVAHRVRGLQSVHLLPPPIHPRLFSTSNSWTLLGAPLTSGCTHCTACIYWSTCSRSQKTTSFAFINVSWESTNQEINIARDTTDPETWVIFSTPGGATCQNQDTCRHGLLSLTSKSWLTGSCILHFRFATFLKIWFVFHSNMHFLICYKLVQNLVIRWRHMHWFQSWPPGCVTCIATLPWNALLALSVSIEFVSSSARVT